MKYDQNKVYFKALIYVIRLLAIKYAIMFTMKFTKLPAMPKE